MGTLTYRKNKFYFCDRSLDGQSHEAIQAGLKYDRDSNQWVTRSHDKARALRRYADSSAEKELKRHFITDLIPPECIIYPDHLAPHTWQIESAWHALTRTPSYIADEAGLGKTISAILAVNSAPGRTLVICPPFLKHNWHQELLKWSTRHCQYYHVKLIESVGDLEYFNADFYILPDSLLTNVAIQEFIVRGGQFKWLIVDEAHRFKNSNAKRTNALLGDENGNGFSLCELAERLIFLSGTPLPNGRPFELYPLLSRIAPESISYRTLEEYWKVYGGGKYITRYENTKLKLSYDLTSSSNLSEFQNELQSKFMIRHQKKDCLKELGPKTRQLIFLDTPDTILKFEKKHLRPDPSQPLGVKEKSLGDLATYRREVGEAKTLPAFHYIHELLEDHPTEKFVVSASHISVVETLARMLSKFGSLKIRGGMSSEEKHKATQAFQTDPSKRVIIGNTMAMGLGNTLTKSPYLIVVEPEWSPGVNEQMEDRVHRITQDKHVYIKYLVLRNSLDERMLRQALYKEGNIQTAMN